jgi:hypothetical protein
MTPRTRKAKKAEATKPTPPVVFPKFAKEFTDEEWKPFWADISEAAEKAESLDAAELADFQTAQKHRSNHLAKKRADAAKRPRTPSARPIGKLPLALERGGLDAVLWPWMKRWIENPLNKNTGELGLIADQGRYLCALVNLAMRPNSKESKAQRVFTDSVAPSLTRRVLPMLRRRLKKLTLEDYKAVTRNPSPDGVKFSTRSHDKRAKLRAGLASLPKFQNKF